MLSKMRGMDGTLRSGVGTGAWAAAEGRVGISRQASLGSKFTTLPLSRKNGLGRSQSTLCHTMTRLKQTGAQLVMQPRCAPVIV